MCFELLNLWMKSFVVATQMKPLQQNIHMIIFVSKQFRKWNFHQILTLATFGRLKGLPVNLFFDQLNIFQGGVLQINLNANSFITPTARVKTAFKVTLTLKPSSTYLLLNKVISLLPNLG